MSNNLSQGLSAGFVIFVIGMVIVSIVLVWGVISVSRPYFAKLEKENAELESCNARLREELGLDPDEKIRRSISEVDTKEELWGIISDVLLNNDRFVMESMQGDSLFLIDNATQNVCTIQVKSGMHFS
jgi:hypothetical protein